MSKQAERGVSLEAQVEKIRAMATLQGAELVDVVVDGRGIRKITGEAGTTANHGHGG